MSEDRGSSSDEAVPRRAAPAYGPVPRYGAPAPHRAADPAATSALQPAPSQPTSPQAGWGPASYEPVPTAGGPTQPVPVHPGLSYPAPARFPPGAPSPRIPTRFLAQFPLRNDYAPWRRRVAASLIDSAIGYIGLIVFAIGYLQLILGFVRTATNLDDPTALPELRGPLVTLGVSGLLFLVDLLWGIYNRWFLGGRTGQTVGKRALKIWLVGRETNRPIGPLNAFVRDLLHLLDSQYYLGYLWPIWDAERQTFADKIAETVVVTTPVEPLQPSARP